MQHQSPGRPGAHLEPRDWNQDQRLDRIGSLRRDEGSREDPEKNESVEPEFPSWFHPPLSLPTVPKLEYLEGTETESLGSSGLTTHRHPGDGLHSPLLSPSFGAGLGSPFEPGAGSLDPRQIIHFLTRKVCVSVQTILMNFLNFETILIRYFSQSILSFSSLKEERQVSSIRPSRFKLSSLFYLYFFSSEIQFFKFKLFHRKH